MPLQIPLERYFLSNSPSRLQVPVNRRICTKMVRFFLQRLLEGKMELERQRTQMGCAARSSGHCWEKTVEKGWAGLSQHNLPALLRPDFGKCVVGFLWGWLVGDLMPDFPCGGRGQFQWGSQLSTILGQDLRTWEADLCLEREGCLAARLRNSPVTDFEVGFGAGCSKSGHFWQSL